MNRDNLIKLDLRKWCNERNVTLFWKELDNGVVELCLQDKETNKICSYLIGNEENKHAVSFSTMITILESIYEELKLKNRISDYEIYLQKFANKMYNGNIELAKNDLICKEVAKYYGV